MTMDFQGLAGQLLSQARSLLPAWFPEGKFVGHEFEIGSLAGEKGSSLRVNVNTGKWSDFATGETGGDLISLYAAKEQIEQADAYRALGGQEIEQPRQQAPLTVAEVLPYCDLDDPPEPLMTFRGRRSTMRWWYFNAIGKPVGCVSRFDWFEDGNPQKDVIPQAWCRMSDGSTRWWWKSFAEPRPLYNLPAVLATKQPIMVVEGEKCVEAAQKIAGARMVVTTWPGGSKALNKADITPLIGKLVYLWPDADDAGMQAMKLLASRLYRQTNQKIIIIESDKLDGWDAADAVDEGWEWDEFKEWASSLKFQYIEGESHETSNTEMAGDQRGGVETERAQHQRDRRGDGAVDSEDSHTRDDAGESDRNNDRVQREDAQAHAGGGSDSGAASATGQAVERVQGSDTRVESDHARPPSTDTGFEAGFGALVAFEHGERVKPFPDPVALWSLVGLQVPVSNNPIPYSNVLNAARLMEGIPELFNSLVWWDDWYKALRTDWQGVEREWQPDDEVRVQLFLQNYCSLPKLELHAIKNACEKFGRDRSRNACLDWMNSLEWDEIKRTEMFFIDHYNAPDNEYTRSVGRNFWISMAARAFQPGCQQDHMVVLEGKTGAGKTSSLRAIGGEFYVSTNVTLSNTKELGEIMQGKLLLEMAELDSIRSAKDIERVKGVITTTTDRYRIPYDRVAKDHPRTCVFVGTTEEAEYIHDSRGGRRFWPIETEGYVSISKLTSMREQLFAEAVHRYKNGEKWYETPESMTREMQAQRQTRDIWFDQIERYVKAQAASGKPYLQMDNVCEELDIPTKERGQLTRNRIGSCLRLLGWQNKPRRIEPGEAPKRVWLPPADMAPPVQQEISEDDLNDDTKFLH